MSNAPTRVVRVATGIAQGEPSTVSEALVQRVRADLGDLPPALVAVFASTAQPLHEVAPRLAAAFPDAALIGASTAGEFTEAGDAKSAATVFAVAGDLKVYAGMGTGLAADPERAVTQALAGLPLSVSGYPHRTAVLLLDPLAGNGEETTLLAASMLGDGVCLAGGAAGDDLAMKRTHVACGGTAASDAVVIAVIFSRAPLGVGVCHGHAPLSRPLRVTRAAGGVVHEIEGRPAWSVWLEETRAHVRARGGDVDAMAPEDEGGYLLRYEAGLASGGSGSESYKIRAPLSRDADGSIHFACGIPEGAVIRITESDAERQVASAREAARRARARLGGPAVLVGGAASGDAPKVAGALVFDCICRNLILRDDFSRAVKGMSEELGGAPVAGFETYGEIALDAGDMSGFHNTTSVVLAFPAE